MLPEEAKKKLSEYGFDVSKLQEAFTSDEEVSLDVPTLYKEKGHSKEELTVFGQNRFKEGQDSYEEIFAKKLHDKAGVDLGSDRKDLDAVLNALQNKFSVGSDKGDFKELQEKYKALEENFKLKEQEFNNKLFKTSIKSKLKGVIDQETKLSKDDLLDLFMLRHNIENKDGSAVVIKDGEVLKDDLLNVISPESYFKQWVDKNNYSVKSGMGGSDTGGGSSVNKFKNFNEFTEYCQANGKSLQWANSEEGQKFLIDNKSKDFVYN